MNADFWIEIGHDVTITLFQGFSLPIVPRKVEGIRPPFTMKRRFFLQTSLGAASVSFLRSALRAQASASYKFQYLVGSCMYGDTSLEAVIQESLKLGTPTLDIWPKKHGTQREQMDELGHDKVEELLQKHQAKIASLTRFDLGAFQLSEEFKVAKRFGAKLVVTGAGGPKNLKGQELKAAVKDFSERLKPVLNEAEEQGVNLTIENHSNTLIHEPDSIRWLVEMTEGQPLGIELAPYHLPQDPALLASLVKDLGSRLKIFCAWQYGKGCMKPMPKAEELEQLPGVGSLDFGPIVKAMLESDYQGYTMIFMHPTPRGIPMMPTVTGVTEKIQESMKYLEHVK